MGLETETILLKYFDLKQKNVIKTGYMDTGSGVK